MKLRKGEIKKSTVLTILCFIFIFAAGFRSRYGGYFSSTGGGNIKYARGDVTITTGDLSTTLGDITADAGDIVATAGDIQAVVGDIVATTGNVVIISGEIVDVDTVWGVKTVTKTISIVPAGADDFAFVANADVAEQPVDLGAIVPAYADILSAQIRCFEAVVGGTMSIDLGVTTGAGDILAAGATDALNEINASAAAGAPEIAATNAVKNVWINATPSANWNTLSAGRYSVMVTYIDYGAAHTWSIP